MKHRERERRVEVLILWHSRHDLRMDHSVLGHYDQDVVDSKGQRESLSCGPHCGGLCKQDSHEGLVLSRYFATNLRKVPVAFSLQHARMPCRIEMATVNGIYRVLKQGAGRFLTSFSYPRL